MKKIIIFLLIFITTSIVNINNTYADESNTEELKTKVEKIFSAFVKRAEKKSTKK
jgi:hypothetical protein